MVQAHIFYSGMVQGVGFRYTAHRIATSLGLVGWARNLADGRVEITVEGEKGTIQRFMDEIDNHFGSYIKKRDVNFSDSPGQFKDFQIAG